MTDDSSQDRLYAGKMLPGDFVFDDRVARVFEDMINRSVPGYSTILAMIGVMAQRYCKPGSRVYDLGCSLGGATLAITRAVPHADYEVIAVDNAPAMIERLAQKLAADPPAVPVHTRLEDVVDTRIDNASVVVLNFTLQFIAPARRDRLIQQIHEGMNPGGVLIVSEKIELPDPQLNELLIDLYHGFKETMGYSTLEISRKRTALEKVLIPETLDRHRARLTGAGFRSLDVWFQCFNFASMVAIKQ
ncbi:MAG: carboxy-S-adenosyl-L-methionine synthase CmoA [Pseudohongiellaceae bacterium]